MPATEARIPVAEDDGLPTRRLLSKVPEITIYFWIIKVLCTTVGETASDFLNVNLSFGLTGTSIVMGILLAIALVTQFKVRKYVPFIYWVNVALISIFGTLVTDNLTDGIGFPLEYSTVIFSVLLLITFGIWYWQEKTLSIHSVFTTKREAFYWLAILFTFALGTATGDLYAEALGIGYATTGIIIAIIVAIIAIAWRAGLNSILAFWVIYIMTRPLGASLGDLLTQSREHGGIGLGATMTTIIFTIGIIVTVLYLAVTKRDVAVAASGEKAEKYSHVGLQVAIVAALFAIVGIGGYFFREHQLQAGLPASSGTATTTPSGNPAPLGDLSQFDSITQSMIAAVNTGDWSGANSHANDLEYAWDNQEAHLKPMNPAAWTHVDGAIDKVLREIRSVNPNQQTALTALNALQAALQNP